MNIPFDSEFDSDSQLDSQSHLDDSATFARCALRGIDTAARAGVVNRTHRVVRQRARFIQARRSHVRGLMVPMIVCSALLVLTCLAVWSGLAQYGAQTEIAQAAADISPGAPDASNQLVVLLLWFVPVSAALLAAVWFRRSRNGFDSETIL